MERALTPLETRFVNEIADSYMAKIRIRREFSQYPEETSLLTYFRTTGTEEGVIEATLHKMGYVTDPAHPDATNDPLSVTLRTGNTPPYRAPSTAETPTPPATPATPTGTRGRRATIATTLIEMGVDIEPGELNLPNIELKLLNEGRITEDQLANAYARMRNLTRVDLKRNPPDPSIREELPDKFVIDNEVIPYRNSTDGSLICATSTIRTAFMGPRIEDRVHRRVEFVLTTRSDLQTYIDRTYNQSATFNTLTEESARRAKNREDVAEVENDDSVMAQTFATILREAVRASASDIHIQPTKDNTRVRMRVDGSLREFNRIPGDLHRQFTNFIRVKGGVSNTRDTKPMDAQIETEIGGQHVNIRVNIVPTVYGLKTAMRLLSTPEQIRPISDLGLSANNRELLDWGLGNPNGILIISGPTGSGKTNTLYSMVRELDQPDVNITTIENPVEIHMDSVAQIQITPDAVNEDMRFRADEALRAVLRQDPDIILVGEMRDRETVRLGVEAAQTGHLVLATTHTNSAAESITRLADLGANPFDLAPSLRLLIAQRLIRKPCPECTHLAPAPAGTFTGTDIPEGTLIPTPIPDKQNTCVQCGGSGHTGRIAIMEILPVRGQVREAIRNKASEIDIIRHARTHGFRTLHEDSLLKLAQGLTTLSEIAKYNQENEA